VCAIFTSLMYVHRPTHLLLHCSELLVHYHLLFVLFFIIAAAMRLTAYSSGHDSASMQAINDKLKSLSLKDFIRVC